MRDVALTLVFVVALGYVLKFPPAGAYLWAWLSMMNPHKLTFGFAFDLPYAQITAITVMLMLVGTKHRKPLPITTLTISQILLFVWMSITCFFAINTSEVVFERWLFVAKIQIMLFVTLMLLRGRRQIDILIWVVTLSIGYYGIKGGIFTVLTGGESRVWGPPGGMIGDNNLLAVALVMLIPLMVYLFQVSRGWFPRAVMAGSILTTAFAILGTQSRGALLAILAMVSFLAVKGRHKVRASLALIALVGMAIAFMPASWTARMERMQTYESDSSALSRLYAWQTLWNAARDRPLVGAGFRADNQTVYRRYAPTGGIWDDFYNNIWVAHSIYFQMLGEHGFPGLALFLWLFASTWWRAGRLAARARGDPEFSDWVPYLMPMIQVSLVGYAVGGAFLSLAYFDLPFYLVAFVVLVDATMNERQTRTEPLPDVAANRPGATPASRSLTT